MQKFMIPAHHAVRDMQECDGSVAEFLVCPVVDKRLIVGILVVGPTVFEQRCIAGMRVLPQL